MYYSKDTLLKCYRMCVIASQFMYVGSFVELKFAFAIIRNNQHKLYRINFLCGSKKKKQKK